MRNDAHPQDSVRRPLTHAFGWIKGSLQTNAFQENTKWISANSISGETFSLGIEKIRLGVVNDYCGLCAGLVAAASIPQWRRGSPILAQQCAREKGLDFGGGQNGKST